MGGSGGESSSPPSRTTSQTGPAPPMPDLPRTADIVIVGGGVAVISPAEVKSLVPQASVDDVVVASYEAESGYADPSSTANALINRARELGATVVQYEQVEAIRTSGQKVAGVRTEHGEID